MQVLSFPLTASGVHEFVRGPGVVARASLDPRLDFVYLRSAPVPSRFRHAAMKRCVSVGQGRAGLCARPKQKLTGILGCGWRRLLG